MLIPVWSEIFKFFSDQVRFGPRLWNLSGRVRDFNFPSIQLCARLCVLCTFWVGPIQWIGNTAKLKIIHNLTFYVVHSQGTNGILNAIFSLWAKIKIFFILYQEIYHGWELIDHLLKVKDNSPKINDLFFKVWVGLFWRRF